MLKFEKGSVMPEDYIKSFREAFAVFQHALVYAVCLHYNISMNQSCFCILLVAYYTFVSQFNCRYDANSKSLKHLKPLSEKFLQSLDGDHDFLGPYPF